MLLDPVKQKSLLDPKQVTEICPHLFSTQFNQRYQDNTVSFTIIMLILIAGISIEPYLTNKGEHTMLYKINKIH